MVFSPLPSVEAKPTVTHGSQQPRPPAHLPVYVFFDVAGALPDVEALQQRCEEAEEGPLRQRQLSCCQQHLPIFLHAWGEVKGPPDFCRN